jgi:prepilin-type processing-associated H-X9-DG protein
MIQDWERSNARCSGRTGAEAFTLTELAVVAGIVTLLLLAGMASVSEFCYKSRQLACTANLRQLGVAMSLYERSNDGRLPLGFVEYNPSKFISWDRLIDSYATTGSGQNHLMSCPSDTIAAKSGDPRRTYSMSRHDMGRGNWPPASENATGVGLWWAPRGKGHASVFNLNPTSSVPAVRMDEIPAPDRTMVLTEQAQSYNVEFSFSGATIDNPSEHLDTSAIQSSRYHGGKFNYLMVDGRVALLSPLETLGENDPAYDDPAATFQNVWLIRSE